MVTEKDVVASYDHQPVEAIRALGPTDLNVVRWARWADVTAAGRVIVLNNDGLTLWDGARTDRIARLKGPGLEMDLAVAATGAIAVSRRNGFLSGTTLTVYDLSTRRAADFALDDPERGQVQFKAWALADDGRILAAGTNHGILVADPASRKVLTALRSDLHDWNKLTFTPNGRAVCGNCIDGTGKRKVAILNLADGRVLARADAQPSEEGLLGFSPDGTVLATTAKQKLILRDATTLNQIGEISATVDDLGAGAFAPDGLTIATGGPDGKLRLWDVKRREELVAIDLGAGAIKKLVFSPDGRKVRYIAQKQIGELDLHAYDPYVEGNLTSNLLRLLPELDRSEAQRVLNRFRYSHPEAYRAGISALASKPTEQ
jgi:dipeptidyl aminopeptidase/acylaminoacyl peptidase